MSVNTNCRKGILLAGGAGTRLYPLNCLVNKHLLPIFGKPMVYYPLSTLMFSGIRDILFISNSETIAAFKKLLGDGQQLGIKITYAVQASPNGVAEALIIGERFIANESFALILGDNIFYGHALPEMLAQVMTNFSGGATLFTYQVADPSRYGVLTIDDMGKPVALIEKPDEYISDYAVTGFYVFEGGAVEVAKALDPSQRNELEITDVNRHYLRSAALNVKHFGRGYAWFDAGTVESLLQASNYISILESRQGVGVAYIEEVAYRKGYIDSVQLSALIEAMPNGPYRAYLERVRAPTVVKQS